MAIIADVAGLHRTRAGHDEQVTMSRVQDKDAELGRREGTYSKRSRPSRWLPVKARRSRMLVTLAVLVTMWLLFKILPSSSPIGLQIGRGSSDRTEAFSGEEEQSDTLSPKGPPLAANPTGAPPRTENDPTNPYQKHYYNDIIKFYNLGATLHKLQRTGGFRPFNRNVLFAASSLKSVAALIPLACEMRKWDRNTVHLAIFGRDDMSIEELQELNGVDTATCDIFWHDARPDYAPYSTELRAETGALFAFKSINELMHPQVMITNDLDEEDYFFTRALRKAAELQNHPVIQIPKNAADKLSWIARLDVEPLREWHEVSVEILVHAPPNSVGSLRRLMSSLYEADYTGLAWPRLTLEIPVEVDPMLKHFLEQVHWPPKKAPQMKHTNLLTVRHRIPSRKISPEEASIHFVESFYPTQSRDDHVLVVSPNAQLSPLFYQYTMYNVLQYKYSDRLSEDVEHLLGISLEAPSTLLDGSTPLKIPDASFYDRPYDLNGHHNGSTPFLWNAPNSGAALYFGDKWTEMHSFITNRIIPQKDSSPSEKHVSAVFPSWLEYFLELTRLRGFAMLYPALQGDTALVTVHHESTHRPEEFDHRSNKQTQTSSGSSESKSLKSKRDLGPGAGEKDPFITPANLPPPMPEQEEPTLLVADIALTKMLLNDGDLLALDRLPLLTFSGDASTLDNTYTAADTFARTFRGSQGGCANDTFFKAGRQRKYTPGFARDLFCFGEETEEDYINQQEPAPVENLDFSDFFASDADDTSGDTDFNNAGEEAVEDAPVLGSDNLAGGMNAAGAQAPLGGDLPGNNLPPAAGNGLPLTDNLPPAANLPPAGNALPVAGNDIPVANFPPAGDLPAAPGAPAPAVFPPPVNAPLDGNLPPMGGNLPPADNVPVVGDAQPAGPPAILNQPPADPQALPPLPPLPPAGGFPPADIPLDPNLNFLAPQPPLPGAGSLDDPAIAQQLAAAGVPQAAPAQPYNLPKRPTVPHNDHERERPMRVREKDGNVVAIPTDVQT